jgi:hypothetical protein
VIKFHKDSTDFAIQMAKLLSMISGVRGWVKSEISCPRGLVLFLLSRFGDDLPLMDHEVIDLIYRDLLILQAELIFGSSLRLYA